MNKIITLALTMVLMALSSFAAGQSAQDANFESVLKAIDVVPTRTQLDQAFPNAQDLAIKALNSTSRTEFERQRAISVLSLYPNAKTRTALERLLKSDEPGSLRKLAVYGLARTFGATADDALASIVLRALQDDDADVRKFATISVKYLDHPAAREFELKRASTQY